MTPFWQTLQKIEAAFCRLAKTAILLYCTCGNSGKKRNTGKVYISLIETLIGKCHVIITTFLT